MNMFKKNGGFTLVELIVVIAILAILAGVAVPAYSGYIAKANQAADIVTLDAIKAGVAAAYAEEGDNTPACIVVADGSLKVGATAAAAADIAGDYLTNFTVYYGAVSSIAIDAASATWSGGEWVFGN